LFKLAHLKSLFRNLSDVFWEAIKKKQFLSLYQGLKTKNIQSFISQFVYFYGYSYFKRVYLEKSGAKSIGTKANLLIAAAAGACTVVVTQVTDLIDFWKPILAASSYFAGSSDRFSHWIRHLLECKRVPLESPKGCEQLLPKVLGLRHSMAWAFPLC
jgi:hypothetical protein